MKKNKCYMCVSTDNVQNNNKTSQITIVETIEDARQFVKNKISEIKKLVDPMIEDGTLSIEHETDLNSIDTMYHLSLNNEKRGFLSAANCYFEIQCFEFVYNTSYKLLGVF